ncbi:hypothetical protein P175DRAFT_0293896 [Aspergillus ochraceoroseus IBT 24754]|uniref:CCZ1/INTU/HSP4 first Longin domain-containing protein n=1 Tax=Aspergillus ochraceoroseus IBT 24754 TaxID=1392256 RepID=A0A2T5LSK9_9EURO|nr:uncharacterized protein P175DRAFT_0293896 [Aspergillus ochraceoroseus IBT 24754]PTU19268.1 hypothetical protein P175DRAFT_0293896 [Aspergillus ochraceoroseus IBT 24754]
MPESGFSSVVPAQLSFLAIYNPLLGPTDETIHEQVVFYTSRAGRSRRQDSTAGTDDKNSSDDKNARLRQIGLAQGMVSFARNFSEGKAVDYVETDKSQIVLHELEKDWWILASVDLTRLPADPQNGSASQRDTPETPSFSYSSRELSPPQLLIQQLRRAHTIFLLHHAASLDSLYDNVGRSAFCMLLETFWLKFAWSWEVLLSGSPAVDMYNGVKLSAGGELGIGVGEEEWGSGEREVLEDFVYRTNGLVDLVVSRFGDPRPIIGGSGTTTKSESSQNSEYQWLGSDSYPRPSDGVIFSGVGALTRQSLVRVSQWMEWIYRYGVDAYGVWEDPTSPRRRARRKRQRGRLSEKNTNSQRTPTDGSQNDISDRPFSPGIPKPLVRGTPQPPPPLKGSEAITGSPTSGQSSPAPSDTGNDWRGVGAETFVKYLTLGYGSAWSFSSGSSTPTPRIEALKQEDRPSQTSSPARPPTKPLDTSEQRRTSKPTDSPRYQSPGKFIIGLQTDVSASDTIYEETDPTNPGSPSEKILKRILHVHTTNPQHQHTTGSAELRVIVYVHQPFIYTFLFDSTTSSLDSPALYHSIHHQLGPLQKPLSHSTSPANAATRISQAPEPTPAALSQRRSPSKQPAHEPVYDLVYDPSNLSIRSSIPNIPDLGTLHPHPLEARTAAAPLSRVESINIHHRLLTTYLETRSRPLELERTCKTSRGWWIVWVRISAAPHEPEEENPNNNNNNNSSPLPGTSTAGPSATAYPKSPPFSAPDPDNRQEEAFLIRRASDHVSSGSGHGRNISSSGGGGGGGSSGGGGGGGGSTNTSRFFRDLGGASSPGLHAARTDLGPGKLVEGLGLDARRYIESLLSLNR